MENQKSKLPDSLIKALGLENHHDIYCHQCFTCGKEFDTYGTTNWTYKDKSRWFCSYSCKNKKEKGETNL